MAERGRIKGTAFFNRYEYLSRLHGDEVLQRVLGALAEADARVLRLPTATEWYPVETVLRVDEAIVAQAFGGQVERMSEVGRFAVVNSVTVIYRFLFQVLSTETVVQTGVSAFKKSSNVGTPVCTRVAPRVIEVRFDDFRPGAASYCHFLRGAILGVLEASGAKGAEVAKTACVLSGAPACTYRATWG